MRPGKGADSGQKRWAMLFLIWLVVGLVVFSFFLLLPALWRHAIRERYSGSRLVACPRDEHTAVVNMDTGHAAATLVDGSPELRLAGCTLWPERAKCNQACLSQAVSTEPYPPGAAQPGRKQIYHLPVVLAAFVGWYLGAIWHSHYLFRARWMEALGLTRTEVKQLVWLYLPHLITAGACLLFAYGVAWLLALCHRKGVLQGILMSTLLCGSVIAMSWYDIAKLPHALFVIEAGYIVLATLTVGAIVGGLFDKLVLRPE